MASGKPQAFNTVEEAFTHYLPNYQLPTDSEGEKSAGARAGRIVAGELMRKFKEGLVKQRKRAAKRPGVGTRRKRKAKSGGKSHG